MGQKRAIIDAAMPRMDKAFAHFESEIASIKAGKASPNVLNGVMVESYGAQMPVNQVASVTVPDARTILVQPWDKNLLAPIEKAIINSNLGMTPDEVQKIVDGFSKRIDEVLAVKEKEIMTV